MILNTALFFKLMQHVCSDRNREVSLSQLVKRLVGLTVTSVSTPLEFNQSNSVYLLFGLAHYMLSIYKE